MKKPFVSDKLAKHRKAQSRLRKIFAIAVLVIVLASAGYFIYANRFQIQGIEVTGTQAVSSDTVVASVDALISGKILYVFPKGNIFLYSKPKLKASLARAYPRLDDIAIQIQNKKL